MLGYINGLIVNFLTIFLEQKRYVLIQVDLPSVDKFFFNLNLFFRNGKNAPSGGGGEERGSSTDPPLMSMEM